MYLVVMGKIWSDMLVGFFKIVNKIKNCFYYIGYIVGGVFNNFFGFCWLGFNVNGVNGIIGDIYVIYGNNLEDSIGKYVSYGCVWMYNVDVEELFNKVVVGIFVIIMYLFKIFEELVKVYGYG